MSALRAVFSSVLEGKSAKKGKKGKDKKKDKKKSDKKENKRKEKEKKGKGKDKKARKKEKRRIENKKGVEEEKEPEQNERIEREQEESTSKEVDGYEIYEEEEDDDEEEAQERRRREGKSNSTKRKKNETSKPSAQITRKKAKKNEDDNIAVAEGKKNAKWNGHNLKGQRYGQWSKTEAAALTDALKTWCRKNGFLGKFNRKDYSFLLREKNQSRNELDKTMYYEISDEMKTRNPQQCYERIRRTFIRSAKGADGMPKKWSAEEEAQLKRLVDKNGTTDWNKIGRSLGRDGQVCRDKYRNTFNILVQKGGEVKKGRFSDEEREKFREIMEEYYEEHGIELGNPEEGKHGEILDDISWFVVAKKLGGNRTEKACYTHWKNVLAAGEKGDFMVENGAWGGFDEDVSLLEQVKEQCVSDDMDEADVDFSLVVIPGRSQTQIVRRWKILKQRSDTRKLKTLSQKIEKYEARVAKERKKHLKSTKRRKKQRKAE